MRSVSPPESKHALDLQGLKAPEITFWTVYEGEQLLGCAALKALSAGQGEVKSMRVDAAARGKGVGSALLNHLLAEARARGYQSLWLETGSMAFFEPARRLYRKHGFVLCEPFGDYRADPNSVFMTLPLLGD
jgi:putative acetyltransferase